MSYRSPARSTLRRARVRSNRFISFPFPSLHRGREQGNPHFRLDESGRPEVVHTTSQRRPEIPRIPLSDGPMHRNRAGLVQFFPDGL